MTEKEWNGGMGVPAGGWDGSNARVHRFGDRVALFLYGDSTYYIPPQEAQEIAALLQTAALEILSGEGFARSTFGTHYVGEDARAEQATDAALAQGIELRRETEA